MLITSHRTLNILAGLVWYTGGIILLIKGCRLLMEAELLKPGAHWPWTAAIVGLLIGTIRAKLIFSRSCRKNLARIAALDPPKIWQFFKPGFFVLLFLMILVGAASSTLAHGNYPFLLCVAALDLTIGAALLGSSYVFWKPESSAI